MRCYRDKINPGPNVWIQTEAKTDCAEKTHSEEDTKKEIFWFQQENPAHYAGRNEDSIRDADENFRWESALRPEAMAAKMKTQKENDPACSILSL